MIMTGLPNGFDAPPLERYLSGWSSRAQCGGVCAPLRDASETSHAGHFQAPQAYCQVEKSSPEAIKLTKPSQPVKFLSQPTIKRKTHNNNP
jgi:hypothetical protein